jgi:hypothetical protein
MPSHVVLNTMKCSVDRTFLKKERMGGREGRKKGKKRERNMKLEEND